MASEVTDADRKRAFELVHEYGGIDNAGELREQIASAIATERATQWQPIETAPKNRKLIVGYFNRLGNWRSVMGCYFTEGVLESDTDESGFAPEGWYEDTEAYEYLMPMDHEPTRWMPLPASPKTQDTNTDASSGTT